MKTLIALALTSMAALAGPPMICHPIEIGSEKSLPWQTSSKDWDARLPSYDLTQLIPDTVALLTPTASLKAHMETLRRAAIYAGSNPELTRELAAKLMARVVKGESSALPAFDAGYFIETVHQLGGHFGKSDPLPGKEGFTLVRQSAAGLQDKQTVEHALTLMGGRH